MSRLSPWQPSWWTAEHLRETIPYMAAGIALMLFGTAMAIAVLGGFRPGGIHTVLVWAAAILVGLIPLIAAEIARARTWASVRATACLVVTAGFGALAIGSAALAIGTAAADVYALTVMDEVEVTVRERGAHLRDELEEPRVEGRVHAHLVAAPNGELGVVPLQREEQVNGTLDGIRQDPFGLRPLTVSPSVSGTVVMSLVGLVLSVISLLVLARETLRLRDAQRRVVRVARRAAQHPQAR